MVFFFFSIRFLFDGLEIDIEIMHNYANSTLLGGFWGDGFPKLACSKMP